MVIALSGCTIHHHVPGENISANVPADVTRNIPTTSYQAPTPKSDSEFIKWTYYVSGEYFDVHVNPTLIYRESNKTTIMVMNDYQSTQVEDWGNYLSVVLVITYDCKHKQDAFLRAIYYAGNMGFDGIVNETDLTGIWKPIKPNSVGEVMWRYACS